MDIFREYDDMLDIIHDDVYMRMFAQTLEGKCTKWFTNSPFDSIASFCNFHDLFLIIWAAEVQE